jgi:quinolinate synthase
MAETAKMLSPRQDGAAAGPVGGLPDGRHDHGRAVARPQGQEHPDALVVCYVNSTAEVKAESDYCCTSANAVAVVQSLPQDRPIIFVPDQHLGRFVEQQTGRDLILWPGYCTTHVLISERRHPARPRSSIPMRS